MNAWLLFWNAVALFIFMSVAFLVAYLRQRVDTVDAAWGLAFVIPASLAFGYQPQPQTLVIGGLVYLWAIRLSTHLIERNRHRPDDPRYKEFSKKWRGSFWPRVYLSVFLLQGALVWLISLPILLSSGKPLHQPAATVTLVCGIAVWLGGFITEAVADHQLSVFIGNKSHRGHTMQSGLWRYSRHPNYFGELTQWFGIGVIASGAHYGWLGFAGPVVLTVLIVFISGIPPIENARKDNPEYQQYKRQTSALIPWLPKKASS